MSLNEKREKGWHEASIMQPAACSNTQFMKQRRNQKDQKHQQHRRQQLRFCGYLLIEANQQPPLFVLQISSRSSVLHGTNSTKPRFLFVNTYTCHLARPTVCVGVSGCKKLRLKIV